MSELQKWWLELAQQDLDRAQHQGNYKDAMRVWDELRGAHAYTGCPEALALRNKAADAARRLSEIDNYCDRRERDTAEQGPQQQGRA